MCPMKQAPPLQPGDKVGIAAPSSSFDRQAFAKGLRLLERWQLKPVFSKQIYSRHRYFAGTHARRLRELQGLLDRKDIKAILFARGGFGLHHILPKLKLTGLKRTPKRIIAYSDLTLLLDRVRRETQLVTYYGPTLCHVGRVASKALNNLYHQALLGTMRDRTWSLGTGSVVKSGRATGRLVGGCLTLLSMSVGTPFEMDTRNSLLLIEDINESVYKIERLLLHLKQAKKLQGVKGIIVSELQDGTRKVSRHEWVSMLREVLADFKGPVAYGFGFGHAKSPYILPLGKRAVLDSRNNTLALIG